MSGNASFNERSRAADVAAWPDDTLNLRYENTAMSACADEAGVYQALLDSIAERGEFFDAFTLINQNSDASCMLPLAAALLCAAARGALLSTLQLVHVCLADDTRFGALVDVVRAARNVRVVILHACGTAPRLATLFGVARPLEARIVREAFFDRDIDALFAMLFDYTQLAVVAHISNQIGFVAARVLAHYIGGSPGCVLSFFECHFSDYGVRHITYLYETKCVLGRMDACKINPGLLRNKNFKF